MIKRALIMVVLVLFLFSTSASSRDAQSGDKGPLNTNRLIQEKSPYLLQHANNPVDWFPWGEKAFEKARNENKLVFLSIGYSTCHWCHVMKRESFEDQEVAEIINKFYVAIKVDREERPDVDQVYMDVSMKMTGRGGWPLTIIMTPEQFPIFAGTYIPRESRHGRTGLVDLLQLAAKSWRDNGEQLSSSGREIVSKLKKNFKPSETGVSRSVLQRAGEILKESFDGQRGGFGMAPKFPRPHIITFILRRYRRTGNAEYLQMAEKTLQAMRQGGIYDHVGFGFHRYSTDARWFAPHFEKMLYDQAGLAQAYLEAFQLTGKSEYAKTARETFLFVLRDMTGREGAFYSAVDAESENVEGKFYLWTHNQILEELGEKEGQLFIKIFGVTEQGNYVEEATGDKTGGNILHLGRTVEEWAKSLGVPKDQLENRLSTSSRLLFESREKRVRPHVDDKIISAWNGLMISALANGAWILKEPHYAAVGGRAADFILTNVRTSEGRLLRRYREGESAVSAFAEDYAFLAKGLLDLYRATLDPERLLQALELSNTLVSLYWDETRRAMFDTSSDGETLIMRPRKIYDGAMPSANSVALEVFARLFLISGDGKWTQIANKMLSGLAKDIEEYPPGYTYLLQGADLLLEPTREVVISGELGSPDTQKMLDVLRASYIPETSLIFRPSGNPEIITKLAPYTKGMKQVDGKATVYVCQNFACKKPETEPGELGRMLEKAP